MAAVVGLPPEVVLSIHRVLNIQDGPDVDPLDTLSAAFDPVNVLNELFPDEASLAQLDAVQARLAADEAALQSEIDGLHADLARSQDPGRMQLIQEMISDLLGQMSRIREKATESEAVVRNITRDIQALDLAKKNLILSMTTLKRLQMLVNALAQLEELVQARKYAEIAQTLGAVKQIGTAFTPFNAVPRVAQVWRRVQEIQGTLRGMIDTDFDAFYVQDPAHPIKSSTIAAACLVADALGPDARAHLVERYVALELKDYRRVFRVADANEAAGLDNVPRRFAWFRRRLGAHELEAGRVFPAAWRVGWALFAKFVEITRDDMAALLAKAGTGLTVQTLLDTLQQTMEFEASIAKKFATPVNEILRATSSVPARPTKSISTAFEAHMGIYIDAQDKALADMLSRYRGPNSRSSLDTAAAATDGDGDGPALPAVLPSSTELFYFYAQSLESCAKLSIGTGKMLWELARVQRRWLRTYAEDVLVASMKRPPPAGQPRRSMETRFDQQEFKNACLIINTADYCQTTAEELEEKIKEKIDADFKEQVSFQLERDLFFSVISAAITLQLRALEHALDAPLGALARTQWPAQRQVSGPAPYVGDLVRAVESVVELARPAVEGKKYLRNWLDKASGLVLARFTNAVVKSRPLREVGAEQLLIDLQEVKACLLKLPGEALTSTSYTRNVTTGIKHLDALLKVIVTPVDPPEGFILNYTLQIGDASFSNFQKILDLKGTPKPEQSALLDAFLTLTSTRPELATISFLSVLDMNPPAALAPPPAFPAAPASPGPALSVLSEGMGILAALGSPPLGVGSGADGERREGLSEGFKRFVTFGLRRETSGQLG